jgi:selenide,water dikinase
MTQMSPQRIVLVGGGHAHVHVIAIFGRQPVPGVTVTVISNVFETPYSGMLPGLIAGLYTPEQAHIDLKRLTVAAGAHLVYARATGVDRVNRKVLCADREPVPYDVVSIDVGSTPSLDSIAGACEHAIAVKPIATFLEKFDKLRADCLRSGGPRRIAVIGGGAGGVELVLSVRARLRAGAADPDALSFKLVTDGEILPTHNARVSAAFRRVFAERRMQLFENRRVAGLRAGFIDLADGGSLAADAVLVVTQAGAPDWFRTTGLTLDPHGFIAVGPTLQSLSDPHVFAAGDCAALVETPREKAGVYAVREGPPLAGNLRAVVQGRAPQPFRLQPRHLALISTGERYAIGSRGWIKFEGAWAWWWKHRIDRKWMRQYQAFEPPVPAPAQLEP